MKDIIGNVDVKQIKKELTDEKFIRHSNFDQNEIYSVTAHDSPAIMDEIGRLRELAFREAGGGTGKAADIDKYDTASPAYKQLIVWNPREEEIIGGYRYFNCHRTPPEIGSDGCPKLATSGLFVFSDEFKNDYLPYTLELGRSFVSPRYQSRSAGRKSLFALDNLWDGLGALIVNDPEIKYLFGKVTMYTSFNQRARDMILHFLKTQFPDPHKLVFPRKALPTHVPRQELEAIFTGDSYKENYKILSRQVRSLNEIIPPLINSYMNLSSTMKTFGTALNEHFGGVEETGILITIADIYKTKKERHISSYLRQKAERQKAKQKK